MRLIGFDTETFMIQHSVAPPLVCLSVYDESVDQAYLYDAKDAAPEFRKLLDLALSSKDVVLVAQNAQFDCCVLTAHEPKLLPLISQAYAKGKIVCTKLAEILMNSADPKTAGRANPMRFMSRVGQPTLAKSSNSLAGLALYYLREDLSAVKEGNIRTSYDQLADTPISEWPEEARNYAIEDAIYVVRILRCQIERANALARALSVRTVLGDLPRQSYVEFVLQLQATIIGVRIDAARVQEAREELLQAQADAMPPAINAGLYSVNPKSPRGYKKSLKALQSILAKIEALTGYSMERTESGTISTAEIELKTAFEKVDDIMNRGYNVATKLPLSDEALIALNECVDALRAYQLTEKAWKAKSTFVDALGHAMLNPDHRIRFGYQGLKETGRTSSREPNMQNLPRGGKTRSCIIPRDGHIFLQADYSNAELRTLAQIHVDEGRESALAREYQKNKDFDPHLYAALEMMRVEGIDLSYAEGKAILKDKAHPKFKALKSKRQFAKVANFGYAGGLGAAKFVTYAGGQDLKLTIEQARELRDAWLGVWLEMSDYFKLRSEITDGIGDMMDRDIQVHAQMTSDPVYDSVFKFERSTRARFLRNYTTACNTGFQGIAADGAKEALIKIHEECFFVKESPLYRSIPVLFVHDEVLIETPFTSDTPENRAKATAAAMRLKQLMEEGMAKFTPDIPAVAEPCLAVRWTKDMESSMKEDGTLSIYGLDA